MKCYVWLPNAKAWAEMPESTEWRKGFECQRRALEFILCCDLGITGFRFEQGGLQFVICQNWNHVTDVRGQPGYGVKG